MFGMAPVSVKVLRALELPGRVDNPLERRYR